MSVLAMLSFAVLVGVSQARTTVLSLPRGFIFTIPPPSVLVGDSLVYDGDFRRSPGLRVRFSSGADRPLAGPYGVLASSASLVVDVANTGTQTAPQGELLAGPAGGPLQVISRCATPSYTGSDGRGQAFAVDDQTVAYVSDGCGGGPPTLIVDRLGSAAAPAAMPFPRGTVVTDVALAGAFVAFHLRAGGQATIAELNWQTGQEVFQSPDGASRECDSQLPVDTVALEYCGLALQADGKMTRLLGRFASSEAVDPHSSTPQLETSASCAGEIDWHAPTDTDWHVGATDACLDLPIRMASDRFVYVGGLPPVFALEPLSVGDLAGHERYLGNVQYIYGFDGTHVVVDEADCTNLSIVSESVLGDDPPLPFIYGHRCPKRFSAPRLYMGAHPSFQVTVSCPNGCHGPLLTGAGDYLEGQSADFALLPGTQRRLVIRLPSRRVIVRRARHAHHLKILLYMIDVSSYDAYLSPQKQVEYPTARIQTPVIRR